MARAGRAVYVEETIRKEVSWPLPMTFEHIGADARQFATALQTGSVHDKQRFDLDFRRAQVPDAPHLVHAELIRARLDHQPDAATRRSFVFAVRGFEFVPGRVLVHHRSRALAPRAWDRISSAAGTRWRSIRSRSTR